APRPAEDVADFHELRAWARGHGLPRRVFVRADTEPKPIYVDWDSPLAVDGFAKVARGATALRVGEFSPGPWFADDLGTHTAELRTTYSV
ncbi:MAG: lantibiotic dehydratase, partial [Saccharothrix sp.]|nr:lantibiotic dehydratase [Saccharothrix sp.]